MDENFLTRVTQVADPSYMQPSAPRPVQQYQPPQERKRMSTVDVIGGLLDTFAELGGSKPMYRATLDAQLQREREAELYPLEVQKAQLGNQKTQMDIQSGQNEILGQAASYMQRAYQNGGAQGALNMFDAIAPRIGMTPEQIQDERAQLGANPEGYIGALSVLMGGGKQPEYDYIDIIDESGKPVKIAVNRNDPNDRQIVGPAIQRQGSAAIRQMVVDGVAGNYSVGADGKPVFVGGIYEAPRAASGGGGRRPPDSSVKPPSGNSKYAQDEKRRTDAYRDTVNQIERLNKSGLLDAYSGIDYAVTKVAQPVAGFFGGSTGKQTRALEAELAQFKQNMRRAVNPESNYESKQMWDRLSPLFPGVGMGKSGADIRKDLGIMKGLLDEFMRGRQEGALPEAAPPPSLEDARRAIQSGGAKPTVTNDAEYDALPSGTLFVDPNGVERRKP